MKNKQEENETKDNKPEQNKSNLPKEKEKEKDKEKENDKERDKKPQKRFTPPTVDEVAEYCKELNYKIDPQYFIDYYVARGWELKPGQKVKDWKACIRTWKKRDSINPAKVVSAQAYEQRDYSSVQKELEEETSNRVIEMLCRESGLWDETENRPVDGWRHKLDGMKGAS